MDNFFSQFLAIFLNGLSSCFSMLERFTFMGITLLDFSIALLLIGVMLPILLNLAGSGLNRSEAYAKNEIRYAERNMNSKRPYKRYGR